MRTIKFFFLLPVLGALLCGRTALAANVMVKMANFSFTPNNAAINAGDSVTWTNTVLTGHNTTSEVPSKPNLWASSTAGSPLAFTFTFTTAGSYPYECTIHAVSEGMTGTVTVAAPPTTITLAVPSLSAAGVFQFTIQGGAAGKTNLIQAASSLSSSNWVTIGTNTTPGAVFTDSAAAGFPFRFYRTVQIP